MKKLLITSILITLFGCNSTEPYAPKMSDNNRFLQTISFDSNPTGAVCNISRIEEELWLQIPEVKAYDDAVMYSEGQESKDIWLKGVHLNTLPKGSRLLFENIAMPAKLDIERSKDLIIIDCQKAGYQSVFHAYTYKSNPASTYGNLLDPTWVVADYLDEKTGVAFHYADEITIPMHK